MHHVRRILRCQKNVGGIILTFLNFHYLIERETENAFLSDKGHAVKKVCFIESDYAESSQIFGHSLNIWKKNQESSDEKKSYRIN